MKTIEATTRVYRMYMRAPPRAVWDLIPTPERTVRISWTWRVCPLSGRSVQKIHEEGHAGDVSARGDSRRRDRGGRPAAEARADVAHECSGV
jgi:hypothetical protein